MVIILSKKFEGIKSIYIEMCLYKRYLINQEWYKHWTSYCKIKTEFKPTSITTEPPGKINNESLLDNHKQLRDGLMDETDYFLVCKELWDYLYQIYSITREEVWR